MITRNEILKGKECPPELEDNLNILIERCNRFERIIGLELTITSGFRSMEDHLRIYREKGITDKSKIPMQSKHLYCQAVDFYDKDGRLKDMIKHLSEELLNDIEFWYEDLDSTPTWLHCQIVPPRSNKRIFKP